MSTQQTEATQHSQKRPDFHTQHTEDSLRNDLKYEVKMGDIYTVCRWMRNTQREGQGGCGLNEKSGGADDKNIKNP